MFIYSGGITSVYGGREDKSTNKEAEADTREGASSPSSQERGAQVDAVGGSAAQLTHTDVIWYGGWLGTQGTVGDCSILVTGQSNTAVPAALGREGLHSC